MKLNTKDIEVLKTALAACKVLDIEGVVIYEGMARGAKTSLDAAIISEIGLSIPENIKIGIGRVSELDKRLSIFSDASIELKANDSGDVSLMTISSGKTKMQFRCTSASLMRYPKSNDDVKIANIQLSRNEVSLISKSVKTLNSETVVLSVSRSGVAKLESVDSANDRFEIELSSPVKYIDEEQSLVQTYLAGMFVNVLDTMAKEREEIDFTVGEVGSITASIKGHTVMIMPQITGDEE